MTEDASYFSESIDTARDRFLAACAKIGHSVSSYPSSIGQDGGARLFCDVARLGSPDSKFVAVICSAAGGPAGLLGCGAALGALSREGLKDLPREVALLLVHAANPTGPIWPYFPGPNQPNNTAPDWADSVLAEAERRFRKFQDAEGVDWSEMAGRTLASMSPPSWDGSVLRKIAADHLTGAERICVIDPRTGPGQYAAFEVVSCDPERSAARARAERWFTIDVAEESRALGPGNAPCGGGLGGLAAASFVTNVIVEIGTYSMAGVLRAADSNRRDAVSSYPSDPEWRLVAWNAVRSTLRRAYRGLIHDT